ncbi:MAG TPA: hypothetical protein VI704_05495, partial [Bacteroidota bacterium]|nr:hypothetical protein [Bacteroidota bacterium]
MNCAKAQEQFGNAIDGALSLNVQGELSKHLSLCGVCRRDFELESIAKQIVRKSVHRVSTPGDVRNVVMNSLRKEYVDETASTTLFERLFTGRRLFPSLVTALIVVVLIYYFVPPQPSPSHL